MKNIFKNLSTEKLTQPPKWLYWVVFLVCFVFGAIFFFPIQNLESKINSTLSQATGQDITVSQSSLGSGLLRGSPIAFKAEKVDIFLPRSGAQINCYDLQVTPNFLALITLKLSATIDCALDEAGASEVALSASAPVWSLQEFVIDVDLDSLQLKSLAESLKHKGWTGVLDGSIQMSEITRGISYGNMSWDIQGSGLAVPSVKNDFVSLPPLLLDKIQSRGSLVKRKLELEKLEAGVQGTTPLWVDLSANMGLDRMLMPTSGQLKGKLKTDPNFERQHLQILNLDMMFGQIKASGNREFTKEVKGNPISLLMSPPIE